MALAFEIKGKTLLKTGATEIGESPDDDKVTVTFEHFERTIHTSESGPDMIAKVIDLGKKARIRYPLIKYDRTQLQAILDTNVGESTYGTIGTLGADRTLVALSVIPATTGATGYTFSKCRVLGYEDVEWGLHENKIILDIEAIPDPATLSTASTALMVAAAV